MDVQNRRMVEEFGLFVIGLNGERITDMSSDEMELMRKLVGLNIDKRVIRKELVRLFKSNDKTLPAYELYYHITTGDVRMVEAGINAIIIRVLCCDGEHNEEKEFLLSCDLVSEAIKSKVRSI